MANDDQEQSKSPITESSATKSCFVIAPIPDSSTREGKRADQTLRHLIRPVVKERGYEPLRADQDARPGIITTQVLQRVADADLVVADLTDHNANVYYELAIRHAMQKPLVQLIAHDQDLPFDVAGMRTIFVDIYDPDDLEQGKWDLGRHIDAMAESSHRVETPLSVAQQMKQLWESEQPVEKLVAEIASDLASLRTEVRAQRQREPSFVTFGDPGQSVKVTPMGATGAMATKPLGSGGVRVEPVQDVDIQWLGDDVTVRPPPGGTPRTERQRGKRQRSDSSEPGSNG